MKVKISRWDYLPKGTYELVETTGKFNRVIDAMGVNATPRQILIKQDEIGGGILNHLGKPVKVHTFWSVEQNKLKEREIRKKRWERITKLIWPIARYFLEILVVLIGAYLVYRFGWNK